MNTWNAGQILSAVRIRNKMDMGYLGDDANTQNQTLFQFMNIALWKLVRLCYNTEVSDPINVTVDGVIDFKLGNAAITNMFEPLRMLITVNGMESEVARRYSDTAPIGWYCESPNKPIDIRGVIGTLKIKYIRYPRQVTQESDPVDVAEQAYGTLIDEISTQIKLLKNYYDESAAIDGRAKSGYPALTQAATSGRGPSSGGQPPSLQDSAIVRGG